MKKFKQLALIAACAVLSTGVYANVQTNKTQVSVTASTIVSNIPVDFTTKQFALGRPWDFNPYPGFTISGSPTTDNLSVNPLNNMPTLRIIDSVPPNKGLTWFYYCNGLKLKYGNANNQATIVFSGQINAQQPSGGVHCTCSGSACSTTATVPATLKIVS